MLRDSHDPIVSGGGASGAGALSPRDRVRARALPPLPDAPHLAMLDDDGAVTVLALAEGLTSIGRGVHAGVRLDDHTVSRRHAVLIRAGDHVTIADERSLNGLRVNGRRVQSTALRHGDLVELGRVRLRF